MAFLIPAAITAVATGAKIIHDRRERKKAEKAAKKAGKGYAKGREPWRKPLAGPEAFSRPTRADLKGLSSREKKRVKKDYAKARKAQRKEDRDIAAYNKVAMKGQKEALKSGLAMNREALKGQKFARHEYAKQAKEYGKEKKTYKKEFEREKQFARAEAAKTQASIEKYQPAFLPTDTRFQQLENLTPQQQGHLQQLLGNIDPRLHDIRNAPTYQSGQNYLNEILSGSPEAFSRFEAPIKKEFMEQTIPQIAERFTGQNARQSSAFNQTAARAAEDLSLRLAALREGLRFEAVPRGLEYAAAPSNQAANLSQLGLQTQSHQFGNIPGRTGTYLGYNEQPAFFPGTPTPPGMPNFGGGSGFTAPGPIFGSRGGAGPISGGSFAPGGGVSPGRSPGFLGTFGTAAASGVSQGIGAGVGAGLTNYFANKFTSTPTTSTTAPITGPINNMVNSVTGSQPPSPGILDSIKSWFT